MGIVANPLRNSLRERWRRSEPRERQLVGEVRRCSADVRRHVGVPDARRLPSAGGGGYGWSGPRLWGGGGPSPRVKRGTTRPGLRGGGGGGSSKAPRGR